VIGGAPLAFRVERLMPRAPVLPERLRYLQPFRKKFARWRPGKQSSFTVAALKLRELPSDKPGE
jgi:hypothetical protein